MKQKQQNMLPSWMIEPGASGVRTTAKGNSGFVRRTLNEISRVLQNDLLSERLARKSGFLQNIDPRLKLLSLIFFMVMSGVSQSILRLGFLAVIAALLAVMSHVGITAYLKRVWLTLPLILLIVSIPAATNLVIPGKPLFYFYRVPDLKFLNIRLPHELYLSAQGLVLIVKMAMRLGVSFSFGYLLIMTTPWSHITRSLSVFHIPKLVIAMLDMTYRYIFVLARLSTEMFEARHLRTVGTIKNRENRRFVSRSIAFLFVKSSHLSDEIFEAMMCRGYSGVPVALGKFRFSSGDFIWLLNVGIITVVLLII